MKLIIIFILLFSILILFFNIENFSYFNTVTSSTPKSFIKNKDYYTINFSNNANTDTTTSIYENRFNLIPTTINDNTLDKNNGQYNNSYIELRSNKCCLVKKNLVNDSFKYAYTVYNNEDCNLNNFELDQNNQLLFDGVNNWSNDNCSIDNSKLGSCQHYDFECVDFVTQDTCNTFNNNMPTDPQNKKNKFTWKSTPCFSR